MCLFFCHKLLKRFFLQVLVFFRDTTWIASWSSNSLWEMTWLQGKQHTLKSNEKIKHFRNRLLVISTWVFHFKSYLIVLKSTYLAIQLIWTCSPADIVQLLPLCFSVLRIIFSLYNKWRHNQYQFSNHKFCNYLPCFLLIFNK